MEELQSEADLRNSDELGVGSEEKKSGHISQQDLPPLWGAGWRPKVSLDFPSTLPVSYTHLTLPTNREV